MYFDEISILYISFKKIDTLWGRFWAFAIQDRDLGLFEWDSRNGGIFIPDRIVLEYRVILIGITKHNTTEYRKPIKIVYESGLLLKLVVLYWWSTSSAVETETRLIKLINMFPQRLLKKYSARLIPYIPIVEI